MLNSDNFIRCFCSRIPQVRLILNPLLEIIYFEMEIFIFIICLGEGSNIMPLLKGGSQLHLQLFEQSK